MSTYSVHTKPNSSFLPCIRWCRECTRQIAINIAYLESNCLIKFIVWANDSSFGKPRYWMCSLMQDPALSLYPLGLTVMPIPWTCYRAGFLSYLITVQDTCGTLNQIYVHNVSGVLNASDIRHQDYIHHIFFAGCLTKSIFNLKVIVVFAVSLVMCLDICSSIFILSQA